jgi:hypothetical protein
MRYLSLPLWAAVSLVLLVSCSKPPTGPGGTASAISPEARIQQIPLADAKKYQEVPGDYRNWRNPYLVIRNDGVGLLDVSNNEEHLIKLEDLTQALAQLPASAWPYGRVVAVQENGVRARGDDVLIRKNRGIVLGTLEGLHVLVSLGSPPA